MFSKSFQKVSNKNVQKSVNLEKSAFFQNLRRDWEFSSASKISEAFFSEYAHQLTRN